MAGTDDGETTSPPQRVNGDLQNFAVALRRTHGEISRVVHGFALTHGLHPTDVAALGIILDSPQPPTPGRLREQLGLTSGAVTACLDRLEKAGHIRRSKESADRRVVHVHYEEGARAVARQYFLPLAEATARTRERFDERELSAALRFLTALNEELGAVRTPER
ncbi:MarR family winged helix-turn-helix transcriptional regulator [Streptomyces sp. NPDC090127]|uniref:MarR family winged helix-turn-helix transcriptional regulator n=1 Tax=Streptomyces sp. NPDC090127 TaxID=3365953 RepID=UPI00382AD570